MNNYWWYFWLKGEDWSWPIHALKVTMKCIGGLSVQLGDSEEPLQMDNWEEINDILNERMEGWRHAEGRIYGRNHSLSAVFY